MLDAMTDESRRERWERTASWPLVCGLHIEALYHSGATLSFDVRPGRGPCGSEVSASC